ncbi:hypothetical protein Patl1_36135 [Pistacia atlantica]|nr:hypothetical protein Patl1_36135 [Pistacia atlantica]
MDSIWTQSGPTDAWHFIVAVLFAPGFVVARFLLDKFIFGRLAIWLLSNGNLPLKMNEAARAKVGKCSESMWKLTYYATVEFCILKIAYHEPWFRDTKLYFDGYPNQELKLPLELYYMCECGFYIYSIAALLTWETRRKDFSVMMSHHVITVILIGYSYLSSSVLLDLLRLLKRSSDRIPLTLSFFRIGSIILALHDASDVFLEAAKVFKYSENELGASVFFGLFAISWLVLRLVFFPFWVIKSSSYDLLNYLNLSEIYPTVVYYVFNTMLLMLLVFHIYWWVLICSMIRRQLKNRGKVGEDIRSGKPF